jgi:hypothetical protein
VLKHYIAVRPDCLPPRKAKQGFTAFEIALLGHELGHCILPGHLKKNAVPSRTAQEQADFVAGVIVGLMNGRPEQAQAYVYMLDPDGNDEDPPASVRAAALAAGWKKGHQQLADSPETLWPTKTDSEAAPPTTATETDDPWHVKHMLIGSCLTFLVVIWIGRGR